MASQRFDVTVGGTTQTVYNKEAVDKLIKAAQDAGIAVFACDDASLGAGKACGDVFSLSAGSATCTVTPWSPATGTTDKPAPGALVLVTTNGALLQIQGADTTWSYTAGTGWVWASTGNDLTFGVIKITDGSSGGTLRIWSAVTPINDAGNNGADIGNVWTVNKTEGKLQSFGPGTSGTVPSEAPKLGDYVVARSSTDTNKWFFLQLAGTLANFPVWTYSSNQWTPNADYTVNCYAGGHDKQILPTWLLDGRIPVTGYNVGDSVVIGGTAGMRVMLNGLGPETSSTYPPVRGALITSSNGAIFQISTDPTWVAGSAGTTWVTDDTAASGSMVCIQKDLATSGTTSLQWDMAYQTLQTGSTTNYDFEAYVAVKGDTSSKYYAYIFQGSTFKQALTATYDSSRDQTTYSNIGSPVTITGSTSGHYILTTQSNASTVAIDWAQVFRNGRPYTTGGSGGGGGSFILKQIDNRASDPQIILMGDTTTTYYAYQVNQTSTGGVELVPMPANYRSNTNETTYSGDSELGVAGAIVTTQATVATDGSDLDQTKIRYRTEQGRGLGFIVGVSDVTQLLDSDIRLQGELLHADNLTDYAMLGYHEYTATGWNAVELGNEEHHLTLNSFDDGTTAGPSGTNLTKLLGRPLMNWKDSAATPASHADAVALVGLDIVPLQTQIAQLQSPGSRIGVFDTYASLPTNISAFAPIVPTTDDWVLVTADETHGGAPSEYGISAINATSGAITWVYEFSYTNDMSGKVDKQTTSGTITRNVYNATSGTNTLGMQYTDSGTAADTSSIGLTAGAVNILSANSVLSTLGSNAAIGAKAGATPGTTDDVVLSRKLAYASYTDASVFTLGDAKKYSFIDNEVNV